MCMAVAYIISGKCKVLGFSFLKIFCLRYECLDFLSVDGISSMDCLYPTISSSQSRCILCVSCPLKMGWLLPTTWLESISSGLSLCFLGSRSKSSGMTLFLAGNLFSHITIFLITFILFVSFFFCKAPLHCIIFLPHFSFLLLHFIMLHLILSITLT